MTIASQILRAVFQSRLLTERIASMELSCLRVSTSPLKQRGIVCQSGPSFSSFWSSLGVCGSKHKLRLCADRLVLGLRSACWRELAYIVETLRSQMLIGDWTRLDWMARIQERIREEL